MDVSSVVPSSDVSYKISKVTRKTLKSTLSQNQKYKKTMELGQKIPASTYQVGMCDFHEKFSLLQSLYDYWQQNVPVLIIPSSQEDK